MIGRGRLHNDGCWLLQGQTAVHSAACQDSRKQSAHDLETSYQNIMTTDPKTHLFFDRFERLEPVNLDYQQTVDALIAHGGSVSARDNQV